VILSAGPAKAGAAEPALAIGTRVLHGPGAAAGPAKRVYESATRPEDAFPDEPYAITGEALTGSACTVVPRRKASISGFTISGCVWQQPCGRSV